MVNKKQDLDEVELDQEATPELSEKEIKKQKRIEAAEKRKNARRKDKVARWGGVILLGLIMFVGFLLWVSGEMQSEHNQTVAPAIYTPDSHSTTVK